MKLATVESDKPDKLTQGHSSYFDCLPLHPQLMNLVSLTNDAYLNPVEFADEVTLVADKLPLSLRQALYNFKSRGNPSGYILLDNVPIDSMLPRTGDLANKQTRISEAMLAICASRLGDVFRFKAESNGALIQQVFPKRQQAWQQTSQGSKNRLMYHSEAGFNNLTDFVVLIGLREDAANQCKTQIGSLAAILQALPAPVIGVLKQPEFMFSKVDTSFGGGCGPVCRVLTGVGEEIRFRYDEDLLVGLTNRAKAALVQLREVLSHQQQAVTIGRGQICILDNWSCVHGRSKYQAKYDGYDRWLQRMVVSRALPKFNQTCPTHMRLIEQDQWMTILS